MVLNQSRARSAKVKAQADYNTANKRVKESIKKDKNDYVDSLASQAEEAAGQGNIKELYMLSKKLAGKYQQRDKPVKDKNKNVLTTTGEQIKRWASKAEIRRAITSLRSGKAAGPDSIPAEALKAGKETSVDMLHALVTKIWGKEDVPEQWKEGLIIKIPKKGDLNECDNYRGIMLLSVPGKVLNRVLLERMKDDVDLTLRDNQAGFRKNRSCADQIASLRTIIIEQLLEWNSPLYINFIDFEKAFDSVDRHTLWRLMKHYGIPEKIISIVQSIYQGMFCRVVHSGQISESFEVKTGVRQGCLLSPFLFLLVIDWIMKTVTSNRNNGIQWTLLTQLDDLDFADDLALLSH